MLAPRDLSNHLPPPGCRIQPSGALPKCMKFVCLFVLANKLKEEEEGRQVEVCIILAALAPLQVALGRQKVLTGPECNLFFHKFMENSTLLLAVLFYSKVELCPMIPEAPNTQAAGRRETVSRCTILTACLAGCESRPPGLSVRRCFARLTIRQPSEPGTRPPHTHTWQGSGNPRLDQGCEARSECGKRLNMRRNSLGKTVQGPRGVGWSAASTTSGPERADFKGNIHGLLLDSL